jgi:methionyl-tRNA formyltransferase
MTPSQILTQDAQNQGANPQQVLQGALAQVKSGHTVMLQENNSVLLVTRLGDKKAMIHLSTVDSPLILRHSLKSFLEKLKASEVDVIYGDTMNQQLLALMKKIGVNVEKSNLPKFTWMAKV